MDIDTIYVYINICILYIVYKLYVLYTLCYTYDCVYLAPTFL